MKTRHVVLQDQSKLKLTLAGGSRLHADLGVHALVQAIDQNYTVPRGA
jgi:hypothetical protein